VGNPTDTTIAAASLIFGGVLDRFPDLQVVLVHGGGFLPYQAARLDQARRVRTETAVESAGMPSDYLRRFFYDTILFSPGALHSRIALVGAASGGGRSPAVLLYFATTLFFVSSYPRWGQLGLLALTYGAWLVMIWVTGETPGAGVLLLQLSSIGVVAFLGSFLSKQLAHQMTEVVGTRTESARR